MSIASINSSYAQVDDKDIMKNNSILVVDSIILKGNKITKNRIILRELEFSVGSKLTITKLDSLAIKSQQNLMNRSLFNFVTISKNIEGNKCTIEVSVVERWYIWPIPIIQFADRNINSWLEKKDLSRINYGIDLRIDNFRGLMENLNIVLQGGYDIILAFRWSIPYLSKNQVFGMGFAGGIQLNHEVAYQTIDNKEQFYHSSDNFAQELRYGEANFTFRPEFNYLFGFSVGFNNYIFQDTILKLNPEFASSQTIYNYFSVGLGFKLDFRDYKPYPLNGYYFDINLDKKGLGVTDNQVNYFSVGANFDQYIHIYNRWYFAYNFGAKFTNQDTQTPYFIRTGLGYHPYTIRGYELYVVNGQKLGIVKTNFKFNVIPRTNFNINWIKSTKFSESYFEMYTNLFFDIAYVDDIYTNVLNPLSNQLLWSTGIGIDMITYYDLVLRLELSINKQQETGFFISFVAPI
ncbi:MAG: POTRA domain-containing protein [Bacteroidota bacterium]